MKLLQNKNTTRMVSLLGVYLFVAGISWAVFSYLRTDATPAQVAQNVSDNRTKIDPALPKTEECPMNGKMFSKPERDIWETRRPMTVSVENNVDARPQS